MNDDITCIDNSIGPFFWDIDTNKFRLEEFDVDDNRVSYKMISCNDIDGKPVIDNDTSEFRKDNFGWFWPIWASLAKRA